MQDLKLAVLIDADNISPKYVKVILDEAASFGVAACKRIYGDWSDARLKSWKDVLLNNSIIPIQQYSYTTGKNATDSAMIIDAMDLLYAGNVDGFCIVSSDSDFTRLAARLREAGKLVIGMGESKALGPFVKACDQFKYLDLILEHGGSEDASADSTAAAEAGARAAAGDDTAINRDSICRLVCDMIDEMDDGTGWVRTSRVGDQLIKRYPDFDVRNFGSKSLNKFLASFPVLEVEERTLPNGNPIQFVRVHPQPKKAAPKKQPNQPKVTIIYEDENIAVLYKPTHLLCHSDRTGDANLVDAFCAQLQASGEYDPKAENRFAPAICNRLDRGTEGLVIAAKKYTALRDMNEIIRDDWMKKEYLTITIGAPPAGRHVAWLQHSEKGNKVRIHAHESEGYKKIITDVTVIRCIGPFALCRIGLITGRTHQIRAHLAYLGHPVLGDIKYGNRNMNEKTGFKTQALCAQRLTFGNIPEGNTLHYLSGRVIKLADPEIVKQFDALERKPGQE